MRSSAKPFRDVEINTMKTLPLAFFLLAVSFHGNACTSHAALVFSSALQADFEFEVVEGPLSEIDGVNVGDILFFRAIGSLEFTLDDSVTGATSMAFTNVTGTLTGVAPTAFLPFELTPEVEFVGGSLDDIQRDGEGEITSARVAGLQMLWEMAGTPAILGGDEVLLYSTDPLEFNGDVSGIPFSPGDTLFGPDDFEVYLDAGLGNPGLPDGDPLAAIGRNRTLTAVPEPGTAAVCAAVAGVIVVRHRRRKKSPQNLATAS